MTFKLAITINCLTTEKSVTAFTNIETTVCGGELVSAGGPELSGAV